jgi:hypothetical protein
MAKPYPTRALRQRYGRMSPHEMLNKIAPAYDVGIAVSTRGRNVRKVTKKDLDGALNIPRRDVAGASHVQLVATMRHYDGGTGGERGYYSNIFVAWRVGTQTWRTAGVRVLPFEAERIARALELVTSSSPGSREPDRIGGTGATTELHATAMPNGSVLIYVVFEWMGHPYRSRGVEVKNGERVAIAGGLRSFAGMRGRAKG